MAPPLEPESSVRLIDVARVAGVSRSTASNVFNKPEMVRPKLRERVEAAARDLGYAGPDPKGRLLRAGKFNALAVLPPARWGVADTLRNPVFSLFLRGVGEACDEIGASLVLMPDVPGSAGVRDALVDGLIFARIEHVDEVRPARLRRLPFAVVDVDAGPEIASVRVDARAGAEAAAQHLLDLGHRRFAILSFLRGSGRPVLHPPGAPRPPEAAGMPTDQEKYRGYADAFAAAGLDIAAMPMVQADPWSASAAAMLLDAAPGATAVLSMSVMQAMAVITEAGRRGLSVPGDLSVVGYNDIPEAARFTPPVTTIDGMSTEKGRIAARLVLGRRAARQDVIAPRLIVRGSTAAPRDRE
jgi:DNA-binding LacI/PurR family transcriptional regulator